MRGETVWKFGIGPEWELREQPRGVEVVLIRAPTARFTVIDLQDGIPHVESNLGCLRH